MVSGWHCTAKEIRVYIDGLDIGKSGVGSIRNDTASICGHVNTGFSVLYNYNKLDPGVHTIAVYADGVHLETREFNSIRSGGVPYHEVETRSVPVVDFPEFGTTTILRWSRAKQNFVPEVVVEDDHFAAVGDLLHKPFYGTVFRKALPPGGDQTTFTFELNNGSLKLTRQSALSGTCVFTGEYSAMATGVNSRGTYTCSDSTSGTYVASNLAVNGLGAYSGSLNVVPNGGAPSFMEVHTGYDKRYETPFLSRR